MNAAEIHLLFNHIPSLGTIFGLLVLIYALLSKKLEFFRLSLVVFVLAALGAAVTYFSGEGAEETVENLPDVTHSLIEVHEEAALVAFIAIIVLGIISLYGLFAYRRRMPGWFMTLIVVSGLVTGGAMVWTSGLGGEINHPELRDEVPAGAEERTEYDD